MAVKLLVGRVGYRNISALIRTCNFSFTTQVQFSALNDHRKDGLRVIHDRDQCQFTVLLGSGLSENAVLLYEYTKKGTVNLLHTRVPTPYRGQGIAQLLAKAAMDFVVEENLKACVTCWYIKKYVEENPHASFQKHVIDKC
ncbi:protein NATD1-like [Protopterus annectens]|uniref:protein NATD1-like n=1 Tax=Protopterus annectens TaxID=7888 RepID=UPI001CFADE5A|nr:protein NATD1-like [Protopterus annectens]